MRKSTPLLLILALLLVGCDTAKTSRDSIASAKGALDKAKVEYKCGADTPPSNVAFCGKLQSAVAVKDLAIDALEVYCSGPQFESGGACQPSSDPDKRKVAATKLQAAINQLNQVMNDLKPFLKGAK